MAEEKEGEHPEGSEEDKAKEGKGKKGSKKLLIIIIAAALVLAGAGVGAFLFLGGKGEKGGAEHGAEPAAEHGGGHKDDKTAGKSVLVSLDPFILNLAEQGRFLKATMQMELSGIEVQPMVTDKVPQVRDAIITLVSSKSADALSSAEGKLQLKDDILLRVNIVIGKDVVKNIYFTEFVMQ